MASKHDRWATAGEVWAHARGRFVIAGGLFGYAALSLARNEWTEEFERVRPIAWTLDRFPPWLIVVAALSFALWATFEWAHHTAWALEADTAAVPRPNIRFERSRPASASIGGRLLVSNTDPAKPTYIDAEAYFVRAEFVNRRRPTPPTCSLDRPHVRIRYYESIDESRDPFALVRDGRVAEAPQQYEPANPTSPIRSPREVALTEVRVGQSMTVDLLVRVDGETEARTWSDDTIGFGETPFVPGEYLAVVEIEGDNMTDTVVERFRLTVPDAPEGPDARMTADRITQ